MKIQEAIQAYGKNNVKVLMPGKILRSAFGLIAYTSSSDEPIPNVLFNIVEKRYKLGDNYKIEFEPTVPGIASEHFYLCDFNNMINNHRDKYQVVLVLNSECSVIPFTIKHSVAREVVEDVLWLCKGKQLLETEKSIVESLTELVERDKRMTVEVPQAHYYFIRDIRKEFC